jgi:hypothetical protein
MSGTPLDPPASCLVDTGPSSLGVKCQVSNQNQGYELMKPYLFTPFTISGPDA